MCHAVTCFQGEKLVGVQVRCPTCRHPGHGAWFAAESVLLIQCDACCLCGVVLQVREFDVVDACPYPVDFHWEKDGKPTSQRLFEKNSPLPAAKMLTLLRTQPFTITAVNGETGEKLGDYQVLLAVSPQQIKHLQPPWPCTICQQSTV